MKLTARSKKCFVSVYKRDLHLVEIPTMFPEVYGQIAQSGSGRERERERESESESEIEGEGESDSIPSR